MEKPRGRILQGHVASIQQVIGSAIPTLTVGLFLGSWSCRALRAEQNIPRSRCIPFLSTRYVIR